MNPDDAFLRDYLLNRRWLDTNQPGGRGPASDSGSSEHDKADDFERAYNFRFEEEGGTEIVGHPRTQEFSLREKDSSRAKARKAKEERKDAERRQRVEELKRLKAMKRQEIESRLAQIRKASGATFDEDAID